MKKKVVWISACVAAALCLTTSIGLAFAVTPQETLDDLIQASGNASGSGTEITYGVENTDGTDPADFVSSYIYQNVQAVFPGMQLKPYSGNTESSSDVSDISDHPAVQENSSGVASSAVQTASASDSAQAVSQAGTFSTQTQTVPLEHYVSTLVIDGNIIPYVDSYQTSTAPDNTAGLWLGKDSVKDGTWGYFIGHNPGIFTCAASLIPGDAMTVWDSDGNTRTYHVVKEFDVESGTNWSQVQDAVTGYGESVILQTCIDGGTEYRIIIAA